MDVLAALGYGPHFAAQMARLPDTASLHVARVTAESRGFCELAGAPYTSAELPGTLRHNLSAEQKPTTGDWVAVEARDDRAVIRHVLERRTVLLRRAAGSTTRTQVVAANVDTFFIVTSANADLNPRRLERYLAAVWDGGAEPVILLNKSDLVVDAQELLASLVPITAKATALSLSAHTGHGIDQLLPYLAPGKTVGFIGSSGVGKSTIVNRLCSELDRATQPVDADGKGRHTTTRRELFLLPGGCALIDTPGMRELGVLAADSAIDTTFTDVSALAQGCRFPDCEHETEPECAVRAAVETGVLSSERLLSYQKLRKEVAAAAGRRDPARGATAKRRWKTVHKEMRHASRTSKKRQA